jgi:hypothetical protein
MARRKPALSSGDSPPALVADHIERSIFVIRGEKVLLDAQLAAFYDVPTRRLVEQVKRNIERFPGNFMFQLSGEEWQVLRSQFATSNPGPPARPPRTATRGGRRYAPYAFTEQGVAMLSSVLRSKRAVEVNIQIMRAFVRLRQLLTVHKELAARLTKLEEKMRTRDHAANQQFQQIFALLDQLFNPPPPPPPRIGFHTERENLEGIGYGG